MTVMKSKHQGGYVLKELVISIDVSTDEEADAEEADDAEAVDG